MTTGAGGDLVLVYDAAEGPYDGIAAYARHLAVALSEAGTPTNVVHHRDPVASRAGTIVLQYNPFSYARWGFAPGLVLWMARRRRHGTRVGAMVHEPFVAPTDAASALMAAWQRVQLAAIKCTAEFVIAPSADAARRIGGAPAVVPVGSNIPDHRASRDETRAALGVTPDDVVLATFAHSGAGRDARHVAAAATAASASRSRCLLLMLGAAAPEPDSLPPDIRIHRPGPLPDDELAAHLAAGDIFLATYLDGVSTRRTSLIAALQHGLPVVGTTVGRSDDLLLYDEGLVVVDAGDVDRFASAVADLAVDPDERARRGEAARALFERAFDWPVVANRVLAAA